MKKLLLLLPLILGVAVFAPVAEAKDKKKDKHEDDWRKYVPEARQYVRNLQNYCRQVENRVLQLGASRRDLGQLQQIDAEANRLLGKVEHGDFDRQEIAERCNQLHDVAQELQKSVEYAARRQSGYYRDDDDRDYKHRRR